jgi:hypothetical protein
MKTRLIAELGADEMNSVMRHPAQAFVRERVCTLVTQLRRCETAEDYDEFQRLLFGYVVTHEQHWGRLRQTCKRLERGKAVPSDAPELGNGLDPGDRESWQLEEITYERLVRQLRSVGDALAWRVYRFDRRCMLVLSRNEAPGPMAPKQGLGSELGKVDEIWKERGHFALLHDLTSCLRIGDLTEFRPDLRVVLEVKSRAGARDSRQQARMTAAMEAINNGGPLPGCDERLIDVDVNFRTHLAKLNDAVTIAAERGECAMKVPGGRALTAANLITMASSPRFPDLTDWLPLLDRQRATVLRRAGIENVTNHLSRKSTDWAARSAVAVPYGVYPLEPGACADMICDFAVVEFIMAPDELLRRAERLGFETEPLLPQSGDGTLAPSQPLFRLRRGDRALVVRAPMCHQFLGELLDIDVFLSSIVALLDRPKLPSSPLVTFRNEAAVWR